MDRKLLNKVFFKLWSLLKIEFNTSVLIYNKKMEIKKEYKYNLSRNKEMV